MTRAIAVFGATGNVGSGVVAGLLDRLGEEGGTVVRLVTRRPAELRGLFAERDGFRLEAVEGDVTCPETLPHAMEGVERVFLSLPQCLSSAEIESVSAAFADAAVSAGVKTLVRLSSLGIDARGRQAGKQGQGGLGAAHVAGEEYARTRGLKVTSIRPTSFSSNFVRYDYESVKSSRTFASPLGRTAAVNWVTCRDIGRVAAVALLDPSWDGQVLDVTGPPSSTLTAGAMAALLSARTGKEVNYREVPPPPVPDMEQLWGFLRGGGFDISTGNVKAVTGEEPICFSDFLAGLDFQ